LGETPLEYQDLLFDPQTSGGLCISVDAEDADALLGELQNAVPAAQRIGSVCAYQGGKRVLLAD
ncbi:MAG: selenide, water dikinase SelD, partial [Oscillospiraceae bacterium]|nr:selenide, water dikinase SelD [Oscillospiraceae bacterium]